MTKHWLRNGVAYCDGSTIADCHVYPDCDCELWDTGGEECHPKTQHQKCRKLDWVNACDLSDTFDDAISPRPSVLSFENDGDGELVFPDGEIHIDWEGEWCTWGYVDV